MKMRTLIAGLSVIALSVTAVPLLASAQPSGGPGFDRAGQGQGAHKRPNKEQRVQFRKRMKARFGKMLREKMQLPEAKARQVERLVRNNMKQKRPLRKQMRQYRMTLHNLLKDDSNDQRAFADTLRGLKQTRESLRLLHETQVAGLQKVLTPKQQAQLLVAHHKMRRHMRRGGRRGRHGKRGWNGRRGHRGRGNPTGDAPEQD